MKFPLFICSFTLVLENLLTEKNWHPGNLITQAFSPSFWVLTPRKPSHGKAADTAYRVHN